MLTRIRKAQGSERAFTLIELIVVIIIIGILAAIGVAAYTQFIGQSKGEALTTTATQVERNYLANAAFKQSTDTDPRLISGPSLDKALGELETAGVQVWVWSGTAAIKGTPATPCAATPCTGFANGTGTLVYTNKARNATAMPGIVQVVGFTQGDDEAVCIYLAAKHNQKGTLLSSNTPVAVKQTANASGRVDC